jgi:topoisomerase-4 subunit B
LITFFYREMPGLIESGRLYLAQPPLYRVSQGGKTFYARDDEDKERIVAKELTGRGKVEISRFKGLGEMPPRQLKETTMSPKGRTLLRVTLEAAAGEEPEMEAKAAAELVEHLMGRKPELRFQFLQENARFVQDIDV